MPTPHPTSPNPHPSRSPNIGIIGTGISGLRAAASLLSSSFPSTPFKITLLEARSRLGGRIAQHRLSNGHLVDVGANWIHGAGENPLLSLAKKTGTGLVDFELAGSLVVDEDGEVLDRGEGEGVMGGMWDLMGSAWGVSREGRGEEGGGIEKGRTLEEFVKERIPVEGVVKGEGEEGERRRRRRLAQMCEGWGNFVGSEIGKQSLRFFWLEEGVEGENLFCAGTYRKILEEVARPVVEGAKIMLNTKVVGIRGRSAGSRGKVGIVTADGREMEFDEVIVTTPLGWLKQNLNAFQPPLPHRLAQAIQNIGYGSLEKVYISFPKAFWLTGEGELKGFCHWLSPKYAQDMNPHRWMNECLEMGSFGGPDGHATLLFYIHGDQSAHITSTARGLAGEQERKAFLSSYFKPYYSRLPSYDESNTDCQPSGCFSTDWLGDDLAGNGSYSNFQAGLEEGDKDIETMRAGVPEEGIWLAGEHTAPFMALGTATGAYCSGDDVARRIEEAYGRGCK